MKGVNIVECQLFEKTIQFWNHLSLIVVTIKNFDYLESKLNQNNKNK